jgi:ribonuclease BN (tRNA processing enzyme)
VRLTVLGASPSFPNPGDASSGYLVGAASTTLLVDCGHGVTSVLQTVIDARELNAIVISHMHPDHFFDLIPLKYAFQFRYHPSKPVPLWLPPEGLQVLARLGNALHLPEDFFHDCFQPQEYDPEGSLTVGSMTVDFALTAHFIPAWAMRFSAAGEAGDLGYSSDTGESTNVSRLLQGVSLGLVESTVLEYLEPAEADGHLSAPLAGRLARQADVERLLLTHYPDNLGDRILRAATATFGGPTELARSGRSYEV